MALSGPAGVTDSHIYSNKHDFICVVWFVMITFLLLIFLPVPVLCGRGFPGFSNWMVTTSPLPLDLMWRRPPLSPPARAAVLALMKSRLSSFGSCNSTTVYMTQGTDSHSWMLTTMEHRYPSQHLTPPRTPPGAVWESTIKTVET